MKPAKEILDEWPHKKQFNLADSQLLFLIESVQADARSDLRKEMNAWMSPFKEELSNVTTERDALLAEKETRNNWKYCPECGCLEFRDEGGEEKQCKNCLQHWFLTINYTEVVRENLILKQEIQKELSELKAKEESFGNEFSAVMILKEQLAEAKKKINSLNEIHKCMNEAYLELQKERDDYREELKWYAKGRAYNAMREICHYSLDSGKRAKEVLARYKSHGTKGRE